MARRSWAASGDGAVDEQVAQAAIAQRLQMADALRQRGLAGASLDNVGGQLVGNPYARALSSGLDSYRAGREQKGAEEDAMALAESKRERLTKALSGAGGVNTPDGMIEYGTRLLADPSTAEVGQFYIQLGQKAIDRAAAREEEDRRFKRQDDAAESRFNRSETAAERRHRERVEAEQKRAEASLRAQQQREAARLAAANAGGGRGPLPAASLQEIQYLRSLDPAEGDTPEIAAAKKAKRDEFFQVKRAQQVVDRGNVQSVLEPGAAPGTVAVDLEKGLPPDKTPTAIRDAASAKAQGEAGGKMAVAMRDVQPILNEVDALFAGTAEGQRAAPTGSGIGRAVDAAGALFGAAPPGAQEAQRLRVLGARLTAKVPRMEGPQSNADRAYYEAQVGQVSDATLPLSVRKAAFEEVKRIWAVKDADPAAPVAPAAPATGGRKTVKFTDLQ